MITERDELDAKVRKIRTTLNHLSQEGYDIVGRLCECEQRKADFERREAVLRLNVGAQRSTHILWQSSSEEDTSTPEKNETEEENKPRAEGLSDLVT